MPDAITATEPVEWTQDALYIQQTLAGNRSAESNFAQMNYLNCFHLICPQLGFICSTLQREGRSFQQFYRIENETREIEETAKATDSEGFSDMEGR
ncbi:hypothetical protein AVEN_220754-1 [Araneus ventricosus]|uniref:Uncharacterized protein n=1 Tax=Araneus ventricosus TaxID=182803 RepID=A0A4Y2AI41_ARAVE|nr:hypothetical protein AVEN_220754-1 [Araneus ventricosus]